MQTAARGGCAFVRPLMLGEEVVELEEVGWLPSCGISAFSIACSGMRKPEQIWADRSVRPGSPMSHDGLPSGTQEACEGWGGG